MKHSLVVIPLFFVQLLPLVIIVSGDEPWDGDTERKSATGRDILLQHRPEEQ